VSTVVSKKSADVSVSGSAGLYRISALTPLGRAWCARHLPGGERTVLDGDVVCEGGGRCRDIVAVMVADRLRVEVNGVDMSGFGFRSES
jgi:hypothetical protein